MHVGRIKLETRCQHVGAVVAKTGLLDTSPPPAHTATGTAGGNAPFAVASGALQWRTLLSHGTAINWGTAEWPVAHSQASGALAFASVQ